MSFWRKWRHWEQRAEEARIIAGLLHDEKARNTMLIIAAEYAELANIARATENSMKPRYAYRERG